MKTRKFNIAERQVFKILMMVAGMIEEFHLSLQHLKKTNEYENKKI